MACGMASGVWRVVRGVRCEHCVRGCSMTQSGVDEVYFGLGLEIGFVVSFGFHFMPFSILPLCKAVVLCCFPSRVIDE